MSTARTLPSMTDLLNRPAEPEPSVFDRQPIRPVKFLTTGITPPADLYVGANDSLQVDIFSATAGLTVDIEIRLLLPNGEISIEAESLTTVALPSNTSGKFKLAEGFLLSVMVRATTANTIRGQIYASVSFIRAFGSSPVVTYTLVQGYVTTIARVSWPILQPDFPTNGKGNLVTHTIPNPGANQAAIFTQAAFIRWRILLIHCTLTTDATVGNRQMEVVSVPVTYRIVSPNTQPASTVGDYTFAPGITTQLTAVNQYQTAWPIDLYFNPSSVLHITPLNFIGAADVLTSITIVTEEWLDE